MGKPEKRGLMGMKNSSSAPNSNQISRRKMHHMKHKHKAGIGDNQKQAVIRQYKKMQHKDSKMRAATTTTAPTTDFRFGGDTEQGTTKGSKAFGSQKRQVAKKSRFHKEEKIRQQKEKQELQKRHEREEEFRKKKQALQRYKTKKRENFKTLAKVNYKGQPNLSAQMELLLSKIEKQKNG